MQRFSGEFIITLPCTLKKRKKWVLASCPALDIHSQGDTEKAAKANLVEAMASFLISCFERGTLDAVLKDCGFTLERHLTVTRDKKSTNVEYLDVPLPFLCDPGWSHQNRCHV